MKQEIDYTKLVPVWQSLHDRIHGTVSIGDPLHPSEWKLYKSLTELFQEIAKGGVSEMGVSAE